MKIGIMGAMLEEVDLIKTLMQSTDITEDGSRHYYHGTINNIDSILTFSRWGKVASSTTATALITKFGITHLLFTGVAGATHPDLKIGDIVVSDTLYQHDMNASPLFPKFEIPLTQTSFFKTSPQLKELAQKAVRKTLETEILAKEHASFNIEHPKMMTGMIATGDQFIADQQKTQQLLADQPEALAVEMEGAAVAQVCYDYDIPFTVIRTISDQADHKAHIDFPLFIKDIASHYSKHIVEHFFRSLHEH